MKCHSRVFFKKLCREISSFIAIRQKQRVFYTKTFSHLWQYVAEFFLERKVFQTKVKEKIQTHILCSITFFRKSCPLCDNVEKYGAAREVADDKEICNAYCFSTATMVSWTWLDVTSYSLALTTWSHFTRYSPASEQAESKLARPVICRNENTPQSATSAIKPFDITQMN